MTINFQYYSSIDKLGDMYISNEHNINGTGMLNDLLLNNIDIAVGNIVISDRVHRNLAVSTPYTVVQRPELELRILISHIAYDCSRTV